MKNTQLSLGANLIEKMIVYRAGLSKIKIVLIVISSETVITNLSADILLESSLGQNKRFIRLASSVWTCSVSNIYLLHIYIQVIQRQQCDLQKQLCGSSRSCQTQP